MAALTEAEAKAARAARMAAAVDEPVRKEKK